MRILIVSDLHYGGKPFHGMNQSKVFSSLYKIIDEEKPDLLLSAGDFGDEATLEMFRPITKACHFLTIYGNHDNVELIRALKNSDGSSCWLQDGTRREYKGLVIAGISGNIAMTKRKPHHKTVEDVEAIISKYSRTGKINILITHEVPEHPALSRNDRILGYKTFNSAIGKLKPELYLCGHIHIPSQIVRFDVTTLLCLDSGMRHAEYATTEYEDGEFASPEIRKMSDKHRPNFTEKANILDDYVGR